MARVTKQIMINVLENTLASVEELRQEGKTDKEILEWLEGDLNYTITHILQ